MRFEFSFSARLAAAGLTAAPLACAFAATPVDREVDAEPRGSVEIRNVAGSVEVTGWNRDSVRVTGELGDDVERLDVRNVDGRVVVAVILRETERGERDYRGASATLHVSAPKASQVEVSTVSAEIGVSGVEGAQRLSSVSGRIDSEFAADLDLKSVSGAVTARGRGRSAVAHVSSVSGHVSLTGVAGELDVHAVSGAIDVVGGVLQRATLGSISGKLELRGALAPDARVELTSTSGAVDVRFKGEAVADYSLTSFSGGIRSCFGPPVARAERGPQQSQHFREGASDARVIVSTLSGSIELCRE